MMAKLMWICGILLIAAGVALGIVLLVSAARPGGIDIHTAAILLVGGVLALGLGSVIDGQATAQTRPPVRSILPEPVIPASTAIPEFDPRSAKPAAAEAAVAATSVIVEEEVSRPTRDTIQALEQARQKIEQAFGDRSEQPLSIAAPPAEEEVAAAAEETVVEEEAVAEDESAAEEEVMDDGQLYVVEERIIRRHPARILSDGTVEAETAEGWMRFENLEHLDEYLDAVEPARG
jgi:hypothetical protein